MRPRDAISFVNECLRLGAGQTEINSKIIRAAEGEFSIIRRHALEEEWRSAFPTIPFLLDFLASARKQQFDISDILISK